MIDGGHPFAARFAGDSEDLSEELWETPVEWIEPPNRRRGGWSGAARVTLRGDDGTAVPCVLKKQENHP